MKKFLLIFVLLPVTLLQAQEIDGFWGLDFGMQKPQVMRRLHRKVNTADLEYGQIEKSLCLTNVEFAGYNFDSALIGFNAYNQLCSGFFRKVAGLKNETPLKDIFHELTESLEKKYGEYQKVEDYDHLFWVDENGNYISLRYEAGNAEWQDEEILTISYTNEKLKNASDFVSDDL